MACCALLVTCVSTAHAGAYGETGEIEESPGTAPAAPMAVVEEEEGWTFVITPQVWAPHIDSGGFAGNASLPGIEQYAATRGFDVQFDGRNHEAVDALDVQWGVQIAAKKGPWAIGLSYQGSDFETRTDIEYNSSTDTTITPINPNVGGQLRPGDRAAQEFVDTSRTDVDLAFSYTFVDVVPNRLDLAAGLGLKMIYADSVRQFQNLNSVIAELSAFDPPGLYQVCHSKDCDEPADFRDRVKSTTWMYGATIPLTAVAHLSDDARWLLPINVAPFLGAETRDDHNVVYKINVDENGFAESVDRQDGTFFAYGVTADAKLTWALSDSLLAYLGMRVQYMNGDSPNSDAYLAYGPLLGISASFTAH
jgi:hypothetical protein